MATRPEVCLWGTYAFYKSITYKFRKKQHPRCTVQKEVKPVQRTDQPAMEQHLQLFPYMRGIERGQSQGQTGYNEDGKWYFIKEIQQFISKFFTELPAGQILNRTTKGATPQLTQRYHTFSNMANTGRICFCRIILRIIINDGLFVL